MDVERPVVNRVRLGKYKKAVMKHNLPLPIGVSDYHLASTEYYYVDKTMMIKEFIDEKPMVSLFTRPRRFGKTLNMDMLRTFFEKTDKDTSVYFIDKKMPGVLIELKYGKECTEEQLVELSKEALQQIIDKRYDIEMKTEGVEKRSRYK